ncbi:kinase-like domain-containing protein [Flammula alnicola]|nr:kinase-like domain-containing protein [Flammula alnicola]
MVRCSIGRLIGKGGSASVHELEGSNGRPVIKKEKISERSLLEHEFEVYTLLKNVAGIPRVKRFETSRLFRAIIMENMGMTLLSFVQRHSEFWPGKVTEFHVAFFAQQMLTIINSIHLKGIVHGDIHPANFTVSKLRGNSELMVRLIDFGAAMVLGFGRARVWRREVPLNHYFASVLRYWLTTDFPNRSNFLQSWNNSSPALAATIVSYPDPSQNLNDNKD